jgi:uncharacterized protein
VAAVAWWKRAAARRRPAGAAALLVLLAVGAALALLAAPAGSALAAAPAGSPAAGAPPAAGLPAVPPSPTQWVTDPGGFLSPGTRESLNEQLRLYQAQTGHQLLVWIGGSTGAEALEDYTVRAFAAWRVGRKGSDDGLAIFVFADDRKVRIEVGYGLEGQFPDAMASRVIDEVMLPRLKAGKRDEAVMAGVGATQSVLAGKPWSTIESGTEDTGTSFGPAAAAPRPEEAPPGAAARGQNDFWHTPFGNILKWVLIAAFLLLLVTHPGMALWLLLNILSGGRGGGGGGGGGGGFSGGGGRSGGGGASGSW